MNNFNNWTKKWDLKPDDYQRVKGAKPKRKPMKLLREVAEIMGLPEGTLRSTMKHYPHKFETLIATAPRRVYYHTDEVIRWWKDVERQRLEKQLSPRTDHGETTQLQGGIRELPRHPGTDREPLGPQQGAPGDGEGGQGA
jgi:hypothetical protein